MKIPKVSILMSSYNHEKFIAKAIESVMYQNFDDWELLIMDDCSTDKTFEIAKNFVNIDDRIKVIKSPYNRGMVQNTNELINQAQGQYIAIINSDDSWKKEKLAKQVDFLDKNPNHGACFTTANTIDENDKILPNTQNPFLALNKNRYEWIHHFFYYGNCLCYPSSLVRKSSYEKSGLFNPAFICLLDLDMWIRICLNGYEIEIIDEKLTNFRILDGELNLSAPNKSTIVRLTLENQRFFYNYIKIANYQEFNKIFPKYESQNREYTAEYYLASLIINSFFSETKISNSKNIQNFGLSFLQERISNDPEFIANLQKDFDFTFKKYLEITALYPSGICFADKKRKRKNIFKFFNNLFFKKQT
ncbi:MAG: glycosyltransferase involved in cell wall biosynthesis [Rickettsiales bacterium]|jgi:glycosyltransferase involved in cell wall biosynthesis